MGLKCPFIEVSKVVFALIASFSYRGMGWLNKPWLRVGGEGLYPEWAKQYFFHDTALHVILWSSVPHRSSRFVSSFYLSSLLCHLSPAPAFVRRFISCHLKLQRDVTTSALALTCEFSSAGLVNNTTRSKCSRTPKTQVQQLKNSVRFCIDQNSGHRGQNTFV